MKLHLIIGLAAAIGGLSGCAQRPGYPYDFKPYVQNEQYAFPQAYADQSWNYPPGTPSDQITASWREAGLIMKVYDHWWTRQTKVVVGPQFYNLPASGQRGLATAVARMYASDHYLLVDYLRDRPVGVYTPAGLQMY